jgi:hypothetical protein
MDMYKEFILRFNDERQREELHKLGIMPFEEPYVLDGDYNKPASTEFTQIDMVSGNCWFYKRDDKGDFETNGGFLLVDIITLKTPITLFSKLRGEIRLEDLVFFNRQKLLTSIEINSCLKSVGTPLHEIEKKAILAELDSNGGDKEKTAEVLQISLKTLYNKLNQYKSQDKVICQMTKEK